MGIVSRYVLLYGQADVGEDMVQSGAEGSDSSLPVTMFQIPEGDVRPCTNCRSTDTVALSIGFLPKIAALLGNSPEFVAYVCRTCRHVDVWLDEAAALPAAEEAVKPARATDLAPA